MSVKSSLTHNAPTTKNQQRADGRRVHEVQFIANRPVSFNLFFVQPLHVLFLFSRQAKLLAKSRPHQSSSCSVFVPRNDNNWLAHHTQPRYDSSHAICVSSERWNAVFALAQHKRRHEESEHQFGTPSNLFICDLQPGKGIRTVIKENKERELRFGDMVERAESDENNGEKEQKIRQAQEEDDIVQLDSSWVITT